MLSIVAPREATSGAFAAGLRMEKKLPSSESLSEKSWQHSRKNSKHTNYEEWRIVRPDQSGLDAFGELHSVELAVHTDGFHGGSPRMCRLGFYDRFRDQHGQNLRISARSVRSPSRTSLAFLGMVSPKEFIGLGRRERPRFSWLASQSRLPKRDWQAGLSRGGGSDFEGKPVRLGQISWESVTTTIYLLKDIG